MSNQPEPIRWVLRNRVAEYLSQSAPSDVGFIPEKISAGDGKFGVELTSIGGGKSRGMEILAVDTGKLKVVFLPDRGMGIWRCEIDKAEFGWQSPVDGPVHPSLVPVFDPSGIGWLEGFDELLVRCGLHSNGAPEFDSKGQLKYPLHGRIANLPASRLEVVVNAAAGTLDVIGTVRESRFLVYSLELQTRYRLHVNSSVIEVTDTVTNLRSQPETMQLLYHINVGAPCVQSGTKIHAAYHELSPKTERAAEGLTHWKECEGPTSGFAEQVYLISPAANADGWSEAVLENAQDERGFSVQFDTSTLPHFNLWKNTGAIEDGYVVGLEPATGYPNTRSFEESNGRVIQLGPGESREFRMRLQPMADAATLQESVDRVAKLQPKNQTLHPKPISTASQL